MVRIDTTEEVISGKNPTEANAENLSENSTEKEENRMNKVSFTIVPMCTRIERPKSSLKAKISQQCFRGGCHTSCHSMVSMVRIAITCYNMDIPLSIPVHPRVCFVIKNC